MLVELRKEGRVIFRQSPYLTYCIALRKMCVEGCFKFSFIYSALSLRGAFSPRGQRFPFARPGHVGSPDSGS